jgi:transposase-like protein
MFKPTYRQKWSHSYCKAKFKCKNCGRQFVQDPQNKLISEETKSLINKLLLEKLPLAGIARVTGVSEGWLQTYVNQLYQQVPRQAQLQGKKKSA